MTNNSGERRAFGEKPWHNGKPARSNRRWYGKFTGPDGNRHTRGASFDTSGAVEAWYEEERRLIDHMRDEGTLHQWLPPRERAKAAKAAAERESVTVADLVRMWLEHKAATDWEESTRQTNERQLNLRLLEIGGNADAFRSMPVTAVSRRAANEWWDAVWEQFPDTAPTNNGAKKHLAAAFRWALHREMIDANPIDLPTRKAKVSKGAKRVDLPTAAEVKALLAATPERLRFPTALALVHGLRTQEVLGLRRWQVKRSVDADGLVSYVVDLSNRRRVRAAVRMTVDGKQVMVDKALKTDASYRVVPVFPEFVAMCENHMNKFAGAGADGLVAITSKGTRVMDTSWNTSLNRAAERVAKAEVGETNKERTAAGLPAVVEGDEDYKEVVARWKRIRKHDGRRFVATALAEAGMSDTAAGAFIGDESGDVLREHYLRHTAEHLAEGVERVGESFRGLAGE